MKKKIRQLMCLAFSAVLCLGTWTGCAQSPVVEDQASQSAEQPGAESAHEPLTICAGLVDFPGLVEALGAVYPEIVLEPVSYKGGNTSGYLQLALENGDIPDIYMDSYFRQESLYKELLIDLSGYDFVNNYSDTMLNDLDIDGSLYVLPSAYHVQGIYYNKTMFAQYGWQAPTSFQELKALIQQIQDADVGITPIRANLRLTGHPFNYFFSMNNTRFFGTPAGAKWKNDFLAGEDTAAGNLEDAVDYFQQWIDAGILQAQDVGSRAGLDAFIYDDTVAMVLNLNVEWSYERDDGSVMEVGIIPWLSEDGSNNMLTTVVNRYFGLNKELAEPGNEQKLEDALKVMEFLSSEEGQGFLNAELEGVLPLRNTVIEEDSPLYEVHDLIEQGYTVPLVYLGWVDHLLYPMAECLNAMIQGTMTGSEMIQIMDETNAQVLADPNADAITQVTEYLTKEQAARLSGMGMVEMTGADAALVSLGDYRNDCQNKYGVNAGIYPGYVTQEQINIFSPWATDTVVMELTGAELETLVQTGMNLEGADEVWFDYVLTVRDDETLSPEQTYTVAISLGDYDPALLEQGRNVTYVGQSVADMLGQYLARYETLDAGCLVWQ